MIVQTIISYFLLLIVLNGCSENIDVCGEYTDLPFKICKGDKSYHYDCKMESLFSAVERGFAGMRADIKEETELNDFSFLIYLSDGGNFCLKECESNKERKIPVKRGTVLLWNNKKFQHSFQSNGDYRLLLGPIYTNAIELLPADLDASILERAETFYKQKLGEYMIVEEQLPDKYLKNLPQLRDILNDSSIMNCSDCLDDNLKENEVTLGQYMVIAPLGSQLKQAGMPGSRASQQDNCIVFNKSVDIEIDKYIIYLHLEKLLGINDKDLQFKIYNKL